MRGLAGRLLPARDWFAIRKLIDDSAETDARIAALSRPGRLNADLNWYRANVWQVLTRHYGTTSLPVFGMWSDGDFALAERQMLHSQRQVTGQWRSQRFDNASHCLHFYRPDARSEEPHGGTEGGP